MNNASLTIALLLQVPTRAGSNPCRVNSVLPSRADRAQSERHAAASGFAEADVALQLVVLAQLGRQHLRLRGRDHQLLGHRHSHLRRRLRRLATGRSERSDQQSKSRVVA